MLSKGISIFMEPPIGCAFWKAISIPERLRITYSFWGVPLYNTIRGLATVMLTPSAIVSFDSRLKLASKSNSCTFPFEMGGMSVP